jgi:hypothetical protein
MEDLLKAIESGLLKLETEKFKKGLDEIILFLE